MENVNETDLKNEESEELEMDSIDTIKESIRMNREISLDDKKIKKLIIDSQEYKKGFKDSLYFCGLFSGLINVGISNDQAYDLLVDLQTSEHNQQMQKLINVNQLEIAKVQENNIKNQSL